MDGSDVVAASKLIGMTSPGEVATADKVGDISETAEDCTRSPCLLGGSIIFDENGIIDVELTRTSTMMLIELVFHFDISIGGFVMCRWQHQIQSGSNFSSKEILGRRLLVRA